MRSSSLDDRVDRAAMYQLRRGTELLDDMSSGLRKYLASNSTEQRPRYPVPPLRVNALSSESWYNHKFKWRTYDEMKSSGWPRISFSGNSDERLESRLRNYIDTKYWTNPYVNGFRSTTIHQTEFAPPAFEESHRDRIRRILRHRETDASRISNNVNIPTKRPKISEDRSAARDLSTTLHSILNVSTSAKSRSRTSTNRSSSKVASKTESKKSASFQKKSTESVSSKKSQAPSQKERLATKRLLNSIKKLTSLIEDRSSAIVWH